jgi:hypothetical protein
VHAAVPYEALKLPGAHTVQDVAFALLVKLPGGQDTGPEVGFGQ